jgi:hypothetical protein
MRTYLASVVLACVFCAVGVNAATEDYVINTFDQASEMSPWGRWWGDATQTYEFDPAMDAGGNASSGSLKGTIGFDRANIPDNQFALYRIFPVHDATKYTNLVFDLYWDPSSPRRPGGDHGVLDIGFRTPSWGQIWLGARTVPTNAGWLHITLPISPTLPNITTAEGVVFKMWAADNPGLTGTAVFWLDNVKLVGITNEVQIVPPSVSLTKPIPGLNLIASLPVAPNAENQRQNIRTVGSGFSWIDSFDEVEFAITISKYPSAAYNNFQTHMFLCPPNALPYGVGDSAPDYNATNAIFFTVANNADGSAYARFAFKTNQPAGNSMFFNSNPANGPVGSLAIIGNSSPLGTWKVKFLYDVLGTVVTVTTPSGSATNFTMPAEAVELFADHGNNNPLYAWIGTQPNRVANIGQSAVISHVRINRDIVLVDDDFTTGLNAVDWRVVAADPPGVVAVTSDAAYWFSWTVPDNGFSPQMSAEIANPAAWQPLTIAPIQILGQKRVLLPSSGLPSPQTGFFRMVKPPPAP